MRVAFLCVLMLAAIPAQAEIFVDVGVHSSEVRSTIANQVGKLTRSEAGAHAGIGARRSVGERGDIGVRLEIDDIGGNLFLAARALDYRYRLSERFAIGGFLGAARLDLATPAYGYYFGAGASWRNIVAGWDLNLDFSLGEKVARDNLLPSDPQGGMPDNFHDVYSLRLSMSYGF